MIHIHSNISHEIHVCHRIHTVLITVVGPLKDQHLVSIFHCNFIYLHRTSFLMCGLSPKQFRNVPMLTIMTGDIKLLELR